MGPIQTIEDLLIFLRRRFWLIAIIAVLGSVTAAYYAKTRKDSYEATAAIQVQGSQTGLAAGGGGSAQLMQSIEQRLTTRDAMLAVIARHGLYEKLPLSLDEKVNLLRASIGFRAIEAAGSGGYGQPAQISAILVTSQADTGILAAAVANDFAQAILEMSSSGQLERARDTFAFYHEEVERLNIAISALEAEIAAYKNSNAAALPSLTAPRQDEMVNIDTSIRELDQQLVALSSEQNQLEARLSELRATERRRLQEIAAQTSVIERQKSVLEARRLALDATFAALPEVERVLSAKERELQQLQASLGSVTLRQAEADTAQRLAERQQGEHFALLDKAVEPQYPVGSSGKKLFLAGVMGSVLAGLALAFVLELLRPVLRSSSQMQRELGVRPVIAIPELDLSPKGLRKARRSRLS